MSTRRRTHEPASTVKPGLTPDRRRRLVENDEYAAFIRRAVRAYGRRVSTGDIEALADLVALSLHLDRAVAEAVGGLRGTFRLVVVYLRFWYATLPATLLGWLWWRYDWPGPALVVGGVAGVAGVW